MHVLRDLTPAEIEIVNGGVGPIGTVIGAAVGAHAAYSNTNSIGAAAGGAILGGVAGFFGDVAGGQAGAAAAIWVTNAIAVGVITNTATSGRTPARSTPPPPPDPYRETD